MLSSAPTGNHAQKHFFSIDQELIYWNFFLDFGPLNLGHLYRYCQALNAKLSDPKLKDRVIYHYCGTHPHKRTNAAYLISSWSLLYLNRPPEEAFKPFRSISPPFPMWHDATPSACPFPLTVLDTLKGLQKVTNTTNNPNPFVPLDKSHTERERERERLDIFTLT